MTRPVHGRLAAGAIGLILASCSTSDSADLQNRNRQFDSPQRGPVQSNVRDSIAAAQKDLGKLYLESILRAQQAEMVVNGSFASNYAKLDLGSLPDTKQYQFALGETGEKEAFAMATAKQEGLVSYMGAVFAIETNIPIIGICQTDQPSQTPPDPPQQVASKVECAPGSSKIDTE